MGGRSMVGMWLVGAALAGLGATQDRPSGYDPMAVANEAKVEQIDLTVRDEAREREIPIRVYLPRETSKAPVVLFSHGLGGSRAASPYLGEHWARRGYVVVFLQHPGSDESVWRGKPLGQRMSALQTAANPANFALRAKDVPAVLDALEDWNADSKHQLSGRLDLERVGMSGHSFGAVTTQAVGGQRYARLGAIYKEPRVKAALALSPSVPRRGDTADAFREVSIPWMLMTGTKDSSPIGGGTPESRQEIFPALPAGDKYELVLDGAEHSAFGDRGLPGDRARRNPNHHRVILALSTAYWDAYLRDDAAARAWLAGEGAKSVLEAGDRWRVK